jgi:hypothetical protein
LIWFKLRLAPPNFAFAHLSPGQSLRLVPSRLPWLTGAFLRQTVDFGVWGAALAAVAVAWLAGVHRRPRGSVAAPFVALCLLLFFGIYLLTPYEMRWQVRNSLERLLFHVWPSLLYATALLLPDLKNSAQAKQASAAHPGHMPSFS